MRALPLVVALVAAAGCGNDEIRRERDKDDKDESDDE